MPFFESYPKFRPCKVRPEAPVWAETETDMTIRVPVDQEPVSISELPWVAISGRERDYHAVTCPHWAAVNSRVFGYDPGACDHRVVPQELLHRGWDALRAMGDEVLVRPMKS